MKTAEGTRTHKMGEPGGGVKRRGWAAILAAAVLLLIMSSPALGASSSIPRIPLMYTTTYSSNTRIPMDGSAKQKGSSVNNSVNFNSLIPGAGGRRTPFNMQFSQTETKGSGGVKTTSTNLGFSMGMTFRHVNLNNSYMLVQSKSLSGGVEANNTNESTNVGMNVGWPKMPYFTMNFSGYNTAGMESNSSMLTMSHRSGGANISYTQLESEGSSVTAPPSKSRSTSIGVSGNNVAKNHFTMSSNAGMTRQQSWTSEVWQSKLDSNNLAFNISDMHIPKMPINVTTSFSRNRQEQRSTDPKTSGARNISAFTNFAAPMKVRTSLSYQNSRNKADGAQSAANETISLSARRELSKKASAIYNNTVSKSQSGGNRTSSFALGSKIGRSSLSTSWNWSSTPGVANAPASNNSSMIVDFSSIVAGNVNLTQQYMQSRADGAKAVTESMSARVPVGPGSSLMVNSTKRRSVFRTDGSFGMTASMSLSRTATVSTTFNRQKDNGRVSGRLWSLNISMILPGRTTMNMSLTQQRDGSSTNLSTSMSINGVM